MFLERSQDLRVAGDLVGAERDALSALGLQPRNKLVLALLAELALDHGDLDGAGGWLFVAAQSPGLAPSPLLLAQARHALAEGDLEGAQGFLDQARPRGRQPARTAALQARLFVLAGDPAAGLGLLSRPRFDLDQHLCLLRGRVLTLQALGAEEEAASWRALLNAQASNGSLDTESVPQLALQIGVSTPRPGR